MASVLISGKPFRLVESIQGYSISAKGWSEIDSRKLSNGFSYIQTHTHIHMNICMKISSRKSDSSAAALIAFTMLTFRSFWGKCCCFWKLADGFSFKRIEDLILFGWCFWEYGVCCGKTKEKRGVSPHGGKTKWKLENFWEKKNWRKTEETLF